MQRPPLPKVDFDFDRPLDQPEDEVFGLSLDAADDPAVKGPLAPLQKLTDRLAAVQKAGDAIRKRRGGKSRADELAEITLGSPAGFVETMDAELGEHMIPLQSNFNLEEFMEAERASSLFEGYEQQRQTNLKLANIGLALAVVLFAVVGYLFGQSYLADLWSVEKPNQGLLSALDKTTAGAVLSAVGVLTPMLCFMVLSQSLADLVGGLMQRSLSWLVPGAIGVGGTLFTVLLLGGGLYIFALVFILITAVVSRVVTAILRAAGAS